MGFVKLCCAAALGALAQAQAESTVSIRDSAHLFAATDAAAAAPLAEEDVSFLVSRLTNTRSPLESKPPTGLPVPDLFHEAAGALLLTVTGADVAAADAVEGAAATFPLTDSSPSTRQAVKTMLTGGTHQRTVEADLCASVDASVADACATDAAVVTWDADARAFTGAVAASAADLFRDAEFFEAVGVSSGEGDFDLDDAATVQLLAELQLFHQLPTLLNESAGGALPRFALLSLVGPQNYADAHGASAAVDAVVAAAVPLILDTWSAAYGDDQYQVTVLRQNAARAAPAAPRRMLSTGSDKATTTGYTMSEISEYQIFTWTWFLLVLIIFFTACSLGGVDIGKDDAGLYSNFKAGSYDRSAHEHDN